MAIVHRGIVLNRHRLTLQGRTHGAISMALCLYAGSALAQVGDKVTLGNWSIDRTEVTIGQFERYVRATGVVTRAEKEGGGFEFGAGWERRPG